MPLLAQTKELLVFLRKNPGIRSAISAPPNATILYAGRFFRPIWQEIDQIRLSTPALLSKRLLPDVLKGITISVREHQDLLSWAKSLDGLQPWRENGFIIWRALSGIYASNARGQVSFCVGSEISRANKVFAATELPVLLRNPKLDATTKDILSYYQRCIQSGQVAVNFGFFGA